LTSAEIKTELTKVTEAVKVDIRKFLHWAGKDLNTLEPIGKLPRLKSELLSYVLKFKKALNAFKNSKHGKEITLETSGKPDKPPLLPEQPIAQASDAQASNAKPAAAQEACQSRPAPANVLKPAPPSSTCPSSTQPYMPPAPPTEPPTAAVPMTMSEPEAEALRRPMVQDWVNYIDGVFNEKKIAEKTLAKIRNDIVKCAVENTGVKFSLFPNIPEALQQWVLLHYPHTLAYETLKKVSTPCTYIFNYLYLPHPPMFYCCMF